MLTIYRTESSGHGRNGPPVSHSLPTFVFWRESFSGANAALGPVAWTWRVFNGHLPLYTDPEPAFLTPVPYVVFVCKTRQSAHHLRLYFKIRLVETYIWRLKIHMYIHIWAIPKSRRLACWLLRERAFLFHAASLRGPGRICWLKAGKKCLKC